MSDHSDGSGNLTGAQAARAYIYGLGSTVNDCLYLSDVGLPGSVGLTVRVGDCETELNGLSTNTALCHDFLPPESRVRLWFDDLLARNIIFS